MAPGPARTASARPVAGVGRILLWKGGSLWIGRDAGAVQAHAHHAIQVTLAAEHPVRLRPASETRWREATAAIVMPDRPHAFDGCGQPVATLFIEPETGAGRALLARYGGADLHLLDDDAVRSHANALHQAFAAHATDATLVDIAQRILDTLAGAAPASATVDPRIAAALDWMRDHLDEDIALPDAAGVAHLSPSRFRHLFVAQTGISFRAWLLWTRVAHAIAKGMSGESWTAAAQGAGFADSAHLSRTCRRMFGLAPTMLVRE